MKKPDTSLFFVALIVLVTIHKCTTEEITVRTENKQIETQEKELKYENEKLSIWK